MRLLTPTENRRLNEMMGFLGITLAVLIALALLSYSPHDASFNVSAQMPDAPQARNWIGPAGAYSADLVFQFFGYAAFLLPMGIVALSLRWFRSQVLDSAVASLIGYGLLVLSVPALVSLWHVPDVRGAIPPGGLLGTLAAAGLHAAFNSVGAHVVTLAAFLAALFLTTPFSFTGTHALLRAPVKKLDPIGRLAARWSAWREAREQKRLRKRVEDNRVIGRQPVPSQNAGGKDARKSIAEKVAEKKDRDEEHDHDAAVDYGAGPVLVLPESAAEATKSKKGAAEPKISRGTTEFPRLHLRRGCYA